MLLTDQTDYPRAYGHGGIVDFIIMYAGAPR